MVWLVSHLKATWPPNANLTQPPQWCVPRGRRDAYHAGSALEAEAVLLALAKELDRTQPGAAGSLHETLTVLRLGVPPTLCPHAALDQCDRVDDLGLSRPRRQRQTLARRADGAALVRRRNDRGRQAIPPRQRSPAPTHTPSSSPARNRRTCRTRPAQ